MRFPVAGDPTISYAAWVRVGAQGDPPGKEGLAALTALMIGQAGTANISYNRLIDMLHPLAAEINGAVADASRPVASRRSR